MSPNVKDVSLRAGSDGGGGSGDSVSESSHLLSMPVSSYSVNNTDVSPNPQPSPEEELASYQLTWLDRILPYVHDHPFCYKIWDNVAAGVTVSLINIPLSISLAVASQSNPVAGVITAVWAGFFSAVFGGSQYNIQGPTGALSGILAKYVMMFGGDECLPVLALTSGLIMFLAFAFNWDRYVMFLPSGVNHGFTLGVAFIIIGGQLNTMGNLNITVHHENFFANLWETITHIGEGDIRAFLVFFISWLTLFTLVKKWRRVPWSVAIAAVGIGIGYLSDNQYIFPLKTLRDKYGELSPTLWKPTSIPPTMWQRPVDVLVGSLSIAFVAVLESLISGKIADGMTKTHMKQRQETLAVSISNVVSGVAGGVPATAALARTALNIRSGANSKLAGVVNALSSCVIAMVLLPIFGYLPLCVVAALLFQVAIGMIESKHLLHAYHIDMAAFLLMMLVAFLCLAMDPTVAIVVGAIVGLLRFAQNVATGYSEVTLTQDMRSGSDFDLKQWDGLGSHTGDIPFHQRMWNSVKNIFGSNPIEDQTDRIRQQLRSNASGAQHQLEAHNTIIYRVVGDLTYISALLHTQRWSRFPSNKNIIVSLRYCYYVDLDGLDALGDAVLLAKERKQIFIISGISPLILPLLLKAEWFEDLRARGHVVQSVREAMQLLNGGPVSLGEGEGFGTSTSTATTLQQRMDASLPPSISNGEMRRLSLDAPLGR